MSGIALVVVGLLLGFIGSTFIRIGIVIAGFGIGYFLGEVFHGSTQAVILTACGGAVVAFICAMLIAHFMFFISGVCAGAIAGVKTFVLIDGPAHDWILAVIVVPAIALLGGFLANRWRRPFLRWATAFTGAALVLSGVGRMGSGFLHNLWRPETTIGSITLAACWIVLTVMGHRVQLANRRQKHRATPE